MANRIEETSRLLRKFWRGFLVAFSLAVVLIAVRMLFYYGFNEYGLNSQPIGVLVLVATVIMIVIAAYFIVRLARLKVKISADPQLREALIDDELTKLYSVEAWKPAFICAVATPYFFLLVSSIYPFCDLLTVALATSVVGSGAYVISYYMKSRP